MNLLSLGIISAVLSATLIQFFLVMLGHNSPKSKQDYRRNEKKSIPLLGGIGIFFSMVVASFFTQNPILIKLLISTVPLIAVSLIDDYKEIKPNYKLLGQVLSAMIWFYLSDLSTNFFAQTGFPISLNIICSLIFIVGMCNAINLLDGVDGQAAIMCSVILLTLGLNSPHLMNVTVAMGGALAGFLYFNRPPARIYLGEAGSSFLGFSIAALGSIMTPSDSPTLSLVAICFIFSLPFCDILSAIIRRKQKKLSIWHGDKEHIHHKLLKIGFGKKQVVAITFSIVAFGNLFAHYLLNINKSYSPYIAILFATTMLLSVYMLLTKAGLHFAKKMSYMSRNLIEKRITKKHSIFDVNKAKTCIIADLLPYYTDLQDREIPEIESFLHEMINYFSTLDHLVGMHLVGNCSIAIYFSEEADFKHNKKIISEKVYEILNNFSLVRSISNTPEGILFFDSLKNENLLAILPNLKKSA